MLGATTTTFVPIAQFEGELNISYILLDSCDSLHTYFDNDILWALHFSNHMHTTYHYTQNYGNAEFTPVSC